MEFEKQYAECTGSAIKIVILDTGLDSTSKVAKETNFIGGVEFFEDFDGNIIQRENATDDVGHGTAVASLIHRELPKAELIPIKVISKNNGNGINTLTAALKYVEMSLDCDIINISIGITCCDNVSQLYKQCKKLTDKGIILVSSCDNSELVTYPAAFDCVIGIEGTRSISSIHNFYHLIDSPTNFICKNIQKRVPWLGNKIETVSGNSFLAPHFTSMIGKLLQNKQYNFYEIINELSNYATGTINISKLPDQAIPFKIEKAITFPFNKEIHSLARNCDMLPFKIIDYFDTKYGVNIGKSLKQLQNINSKSTIIKSIGQLDWDDDFDTVILGHVAELSSASSINWAEYIVEKCKLFGKNLYSFSDIHALVDTQLLSSINLYYPHIDPLPINYIKKIHGIGVPVLGIVGTGSKQGKFTIQLAMRRELLRRGYTIGQLGTEPSALLFDMDAVYPMGYESSVAVSGHEAVVIINSLMAMIERKSCDVILFGTQSHCLLHNLEDEYSYTTLNHELLLGCQADSYILCVNAEDTIEYIERVIAYLESLFNSKVIAIVLSLYTRQLSSTGITKQRKIELEEANPILKKFQEKFSLPCLFIDDPFTAERLVDVFLL